MSYSCQFTVFKHTRLSNNLNVIKKCILHHIHSINQIYDTCIWHSLLYTIVLNWHEYDIVKLYKLSRDQCIMQVSSIVEKMYFFFYFFPQWYKKETKYVIDWYQDFLHWYFYLKLNLIQESVLLMVQFRQVSLC
jgi:hypothetical protein